MKLIVVCFLLTAPTSFGLSGLLEMSQVLWTKLLNGGLSNIGPLDPLQVPVVKVDQSQGRTNYRMVLSNIEILGLNDSSLESIHVGRGSVKSNLSENEAGYVSYNDRNAIDFIRYRFHTVVKESNSNQSHSEDLRVEPLERYLNADAAGGKQDETGSGSKSSRYEESRGKYTDDYNQRHTDNYQQQQHQNPQRTQHQYQQSRGQEDFVPRRESTQQQETQYRHNDGDNDRRYGNIHQRQQQNQYRSSNGDDNRRYGNVQQDGHQNQHYQQPHQHQHQHSRVHDDSVPHQESNHHQRNQHRHNEDVNNDNGQVNIYQEGQRVQYRRPQHQHSHHQGDFVPHRESFGAQESTARPFKQAEYDENYEKHQQIPRIEGFRSSSGVRNSGDRHHNGNNGERGYLVYAQTGSVGNSGNGKNNYQSDQRSRENYERMPSNVGSQKNNGVQQLVERVAIQYPARLSNTHRPCEHVKDDDNVEMMSRGRFNAHGRYQESSERLENQPGYVDIVYTDNNSKKMRHFGNVQVEPREDKIAYSLEDIKRDLENHRRFIVHNFTESELLSKKNDRVRTAEETKRIKDMIRYAKEFQEDQGLFGEGMELIYHYGNGSEAKIYENGKRIKREHVEENENEDDIMHVIIKIRVPVLSVEADYLLLGKVGDQVLRGSGQLNGNFTELIGDFTIEFKKSNNNTMIVRAARAKLVAASQNIKLQGMDENEAVSEILTQGLMAAEAVAAMLADDLATKALNESTADAIIFKMYKELPPN